MRIFNNGDVLVDSGNLYLQNNNGGTYYRLNLAYGDPNHYIYSTGSDGNTMYLGEYGGIFQFINTDGGNNIKFANGAITCVSLTQTSDERLKRNIRNSHYGLKEVMALRPVEYLFKNSDVPQLGLLAQEVKKIIPEVVTGKEGDIEKGEILGISYGNLVPALVSAIKEQQQQIEALKQQNTTLQLQNNSLQSAKADISDVNQLRLQLQELKDMMLKNGLKVEK
jgi:hypothetical protein